MTIVFIHGAGGSKEKWRLLKPFLNDSHLYIDLPGHGERLDATHSSIEAYASALKRELPDEPMIVCGHSMGGLIALELAKQSPHVQGLILIASHYEMFVHPDVLTSLKEGTFPAGLFYASYAKSIDPALLEEEKQALRNVHSNVHYDDFLSCANYNGKANFEALNIPILAIYGTDDRLLSPESSKQVNAIHPDVRIVSIEDAGHYSMIEKPKQVAEAIEHWIKEMFH